MGEALAYVVSVARDGAASATNSALRANTKHFAPLRAAACAARAGALAGAPTARSELRQVLNGGLELVQDTNDQRQVACAFQASLELKRWQQNVRQALRPGAPDDGEAGAAPAKGLP